MNLTEHFTLEELTYSETAICKNIDNTPSQDVIGNLLVLCKEVLEPLRTIIKLPMKVNSGYRSVLVNEAVGGVSTSQHCKGQAADTVAIGMSIKDYYDTVKRLVKDGSLIADQIIYEYKSWVHISYNPNGNNRKEFLIINHDGKGYVHDNKPV
jgi:hypothetical protein